MMPGPPFALSRSVAGVSNTRPLLVVAMIILSILSLLVAFLGCTDDPAVPEESFKLIISIKDALGNPMGGVDIRRANYLDACVREHGTNARGGHPEALSSIDAGFMRPIGPEPEYSYSIGPIYPSPFNPATSIRFSLEDSCYVTLDILDWRGDLVRRLVDEKYDRRGQFQEIWSGQGDHDTHVIDGVYTCRLIAKDIDTGAEVFAGAANCTAYISLDREQCHVIGRTNASGVFETSDQDLFPCTQGHSPQVCTDELADTVGTCSFVDSVRIYMTLQGKAPAGLDTEYSRKIKLVDGINSYAFTWGPEAIAGQRSW